MGTVADRLQQVLAAAGLQPLALDEVTKLEAYLGLIQRWNARINLTAIRDEDGILSRHFVESIAAARALPGEIHTLLDFGSGAGLPGIPIAICRPELAVTLAESQGKKAAFLAEAVRQVRVEARVFAGRAETLPERFDCVMLRAVDRMERAVGMAAGLIHPGGWLALMTTVEDTPGLERAAGAEIVWSKPKPLPGSEKRILLLGRRAP